MRHPSSFGQQKRRGQLSSRGTMFLKAAELLMKFLSFFRTKFSLLLKEPFIFPYGCLEATPCCLAGQQQG
jgi:hypothetical protein